MPLRKRDTVIPIDTSSAQRRDGRTGVGTPGTGIGEDGDPSPSLGRSRATPAVFVKAARASHAWNVDKGTVESWKPSDVAATLNVNDNTGDTRATVLAIDGKDVRTNELTGSLMADMDSARVANRRTGLVWDGRAEPDLPAHLEVQPAPVAECGCCPADPKPDSARYRACGNAVSVPVIEWIGRRMLSADDL